MTMNNDPFDRVPPRVEPSKAPAIIAAIVVIAAIAGGAWYWWQHREAPYLPPPLKSEARPEAAAPPTGPKHPIASESTTPLPALGQSDGVLQQGAIDLVGADVLARFFNIENLARNFVVTVDNLPRETVPARLNPVKPTSGGFMTRGKDATLAMAPENSARYTPFVRVIEHIDAKKAAALYTRFYPLFQQAYEELGYPGKYFNDRMVEAIDNLLDAPELDKPPALVAPHVLYEYKDPELESRSAGQKALMRMGRTHEATVKAKLRELRQEIVAGSRR